MQSVVDGLLAFSGRGACTDAKPRAALWPALDLALDVVDDFSAVARAASRPA